MKGKIMSDNKWHTNNKPTKSGFYWVKSGLDEKQTLWIAEYKKNHEEGGWWETKFAQYISYWYGPIEEPPFIFNDIVIG